MNDGLRRSFQYWEDVGSGLAQAIGPLAAMERSEAVASRVELFWLTVSRMSHILDQSRRGWCWTTNARSPNVSIHGTWKSSQLVRTIAEDEALLDSGVARRIAFMGMSSPKRTRTEIVAVVVDAEPVIVSTIVGITKGERINE